MLFSSNRYESHLQEIARAEKKKLSISIIEQTEEDAFRAAFKEVVQNTDSSHIIVTPLVGRLTASVLREFPDKLFYCIEGNTVMEKDTDTLPHIRFVDVNRIPAFQKAGMLLREYVEKEREKEENGTSKAGVIFYIGTKERRAEFNAFLQGFGEEVTRDRYMLVKELRTLNNRTEALSFIGDLRTRNVRVVLLSASRLNGPCIEQLAQEGVPVITENSAYTDAFSSGIIFSIETSYTTVIRAIIRETEAGRNESIQIESVLVAGEAKELNFFQKTNDFAIRTYF